MTTEQLDNEAQLMGFNSHAAYEAAMQHMMTGEEYDDEEYEEDAA